MSIFFGDFGASRCNVIVFSLLLFSLLCILSVYSMISRKKIKYKQKKGSPMRLYAEISLCELFDKITILEIKTAQISDQKKPATV